MLVQSGHDEALAEALLTLLTDDAHAERLSRAAREVVEARNSAAAFADAFIDSISLARQFPALTGRIAAARVCCGLLRAVALAEERVGRLEARPNGILATLQAKGRAVRGLLSKRA